MRNCKQNSQGKKLRASIVGELIADFNSKANKYTFKFYYAICAYTILGVTTHVMLIWDCQALLQLSLAYTLTNTTYRFSPMPAAKYDQLRFCGRATPLTELMIDFHTNY